MNYLLETTVDTATDAQGSGWVMLVSMLIMVGLMWLLFIRPQKKREKALKDQMSKMSVGDKIITIGGLVGVLANQTEDEVTIYTSMANTPVTFTKSAIQTIIPRNSEKKDDKADKEALKAEKKAKKAKKEDIEE